MLYLVFSDTHGDITRASWLIEQFKDRADGVLHLGDNVQDFHRLRLKYQDKYSLAFLGVSGNCDRGFDDPTSRVFSAGGRRILMVHGHEQHVNYGLETLRLTAREHKANIALYGHTHIPFQEEHAGLLILNPGSLWEPRGGTKAGFLLLEVQDGKAAAILNRYEDFC